MDHAAATASGLDAAIFAALTAVAPAVEPAALDPERPFSEQIELDSIDFLNFVLGLEKRLNISVPDADYAQLASLAGCRACLARVTAS